jgi:large subunit ribosomal protein L3
MEKILGKKIGMSQIFDEQGNVVPVTVVDVNNWIVTQIKTLKADGYDAIQAGLVRDRYIGQSFNPEWLQKKQKHFLQLKEVRINEADFANYNVGKTLAMETVPFNEGDEIAVTGTSRGLGFQGVVKRHGFAGGPKSHGSKFHRIPGSASHMRSQGEVIKGKRYPGHMGVDQVTVKGLKVIRFDRAAGYLFIKGAIPGKKDSLVSVKK